MTDAVDRLYESVDSGALDAVCLRNRVALLVLFGSAARGDRAARDVDVAVRFEAGADHDVLSLISDLHDISGTEAIDLMTLNEAGPLVRERAMANGRLLYQGHNGGFAREQISAIMERLDTDHLRRLELELMSG